MNKKYNTTPYMFMKDIKTAADTAAGTKKRNEHVMELIGMCLATLIILSLILLTVAYIHKPVVNTGGILREKTKMDKLAVALEGKVEP